MAEVISREEAQKIADKCRSRSEGCPLCWEVESNEPNVCCAWCVKFNTQDCVNPPCELLIKEK